MAPRWSVVAIAVGVAACGDVQTGQSVLGSQCGSSLELTPIQRYQGELAGVQDREGAVVLINGDCTGTLVAAVAGPIVVTAGHCVGLGDQPLIAFNVEAEPDGDPLITSGMVIERADTPDYALIRLDALPAVAPTVLTARLSELLGIIQHPRGGPKVIAEGRFVSACAGVLSYANLDTLVGSSGAGVLDRRGRMLGVHTDGTCASDGTGVNTGWTAERIVEASAYLQDVDLER